MNTPALVRLWQLADSGFPAGGFTHSTGLEAAWQHGDIQTAEDVCRLALTVVRQAGHGALPFVTAAHLDPSRLADLDARADLFLNQPVSNRASRAQGRAFLNTSVAVFPEAPLQPVAERVRRDHLCGHHAPLFGAILRLLDVSAESAATLFLYQSARSVLSAGVRLGLVGAFDAQRVQPLVAREIDRTRACSRHRGPDDVVQTAPILDVYQSTQDRLYSRLFQS